MNETADLPLPILFHRALTQFDHGGPASKTSVSTQVLEAWLHTCEGLVDKLGIFSPNEEAEDIATGDLKYLLVPALLGDLLSNPSEPDLNSRKASLQKALASYIRFQTLCEQYALVPPEASLAAQTDAQAKRQLKIQRFQKEKLIRAKLDQLAVNMNGKEEGSDSEASDGDEDSQRECWLLRVESANLRAAEQISQIKQELELLSHASTIPADERDKPLDPPPADLLAELHQAATNLGRQRQQMAADVFRPSHRLPTRSLRQQAEIEVAEAKERSERQERAAKKRAELEADEDYALQKQRNWDDWKDDHERGAGNSKLRPTA